jgi:hypothetical protein
MKTISLFFFICICFSQISFSQFDGNTSPTYPELIAYYQNKVQVEKARVEAMHWQRNQKYFKFNYELTGQRDSILFLGFEHSYKKSEVTGFDRLFYDRMKPYERLITRFQTYTTQDSVRIPKFYIVRHEAFEVINRLKANGVEMKVVDNDTVVKGVDLFIGLFKSTTKPYEGHFLH